MKPLTTFVLLLVLLGNTAGYGKEATSKVPAFNADSAYYFIQKQVSFGPRVPNTTAHRLCVAYLKQQLEQLGWQTQIQNFQAKAFNGQLLQLENIIASFNLACPQRILLAAHWDTRPFADKDEVNQDQPIEGANDGASGIGVLLELARVISQASPTGVGIDIILFDGEDYGEPRGYQAGNTSKAIFWCLGAQYWSKHQHTPNYRAAYGILLDMVGADNATFYQEHWSMYYAAHVVKKLWLTAQHLGYSQYFILQASKGYILDDHWFVSKDARIPMVNIIDHNLTADNLFPLTTIRMLIICSLLISRPYEQ